ncbi:prepilin-type N-terminal cleavage/methylation domain-containing protein [Caldanaerobius fijiensis DSM 17918]|uniref:Prepilin-type N-terminal cleavage/methylation domain-containing protein n=1 Tax=Caldanaerobius fijiensis DSM 17918 TaxID=1121256 RepID=A0A1M4U4X9_9THEO|nr:prepilin-type N-terminal cleavage/methylation domain-containing protein [Caldanaerobius fijiensis]SHE51686.1 prepilin-type N-terminal cleavage/methylation domain-containing protein [Caldanaerobius fijiensis DSM 17918]
MSRGFTLIEVILSLALISMVLMIAFYFSSYSYDYYTRMINDLDIQQNVRYAMHKIVSEVKKVNDRGKIVIENGGRKINIMESNFTAPLDIYYIPETKTIYMYSSAQNDLAYGIDDFNARLEGDLLTISIKVKKKVLSASVKLMYNSGD